MRIWDFLAVAGADHGLLHDIRCILGDGETGLGRNQHGDAARLAELERGRRVAVDEGGFDRGFLRLKTFDHGDQAIMDREQPRAELVPIAGFHRTAGNSGSTGCLRT